MKHKNTECALQAAPHSRIEDVTNIFIKTVGELRVDTVGDKLLYVENKNRGYLNFRAKDFRKTLCLVLSSAGKKPDVKKYLNIFRTLQWIICDPERFTYTQYVKGKMVRVVTVDLEKYELLKKLGENGCEEK